MAHYMESKQIDILCVQAFRESRTMSEEEIETIFAHWPYYAAPRPENDSVFRPALFSLYPILDETLVVYPESNSCTLICDIAFKKDTIRIFNNHLQTISLSGVREEVYSNIPDETQEDTTREVFDLLPGNLKENFIKRSKQARILRNIISVSPHPVIVCGDLNDTPSSYVYRTIKGRLRDGFETKGSGYGYTYRYANKLLRIDYILYSDELEGVNYQSPLELSYSRHNPVIVEFRF
ncbi:MAG: endonuclease/exonuclease/phosphatase family protein [Bacteroides sp.]|nr:endonuclease/exonuclease/phosphatase family protein [Bacteroides sp.]